MTYKYLLLVCGFGFSIVGGNLRSSQFEKQLSLKWIEAPNKLERGIEEFRFELRNNMTTPYVTSEWMLQFGRLDIPNVVIFARLKDSEKKPRVFNPTASVGQLPFETKKLEAGAEEEILASVHISVDEGVYLVWAELRCDRNVKSATYEIVIRGGKIAPSEVPPKN